MARPIQYLGDGVRDPPKETGPHDQAVWMIEVDSKNPWRNSRTGNGSDGYSPGSWFEIDIPQGFIPAEIGELNVYLGTFTTTPTYSGITISARVTEDASFGGSAAAPTDPNYVPSYCIPNLATGPTAATISYQDTTLRLMMTTIGRATASKYLTSSGDDYVPVVSWNFRVGPIGVSQVSTTDYAGTTVTGGDTPIVTMPNPSGSTIRFEMRGAGSNSMMCIRGSSTFGSLPTYGFSPWQVTLILRPVRSAQYGNVSYATAVQYA